ncbi:MAG: response regulator transcription factor [Thermoleophilaceae bacterium]|nr:response regulator transcription factor [Thermoleophilaceae bacterium]
MIRVLIVDDHPALRRGLVAALRYEPGFVTIGVAAGMAAALVEAERSIPDVALVDYQLADGDGLILCHELKLLPKAPGVLIYSAFARPELAMAAMVAGADAIVNKGAQLEELFGAIRTVARGGTALPRLRPGAVERDVARLEPEDLPILGLRMDGATLPEIASVLRVDERDVSRRLTAMLGRLAAALDPGAMTRADG